MNDREEAFRQAFEGQQVQMWTAIPGYIVDVDLDAMTCSVQPTISSTTVLPDGTRKPQNLPILINVPIIFPSAGGFTITFPIAANDEVLVVFSSRCIDSWWLYSGVQQPMEGRMHDLSDGFAFPGPKSVPNTIGGISSTHLQIRNNAGTTYFQLGSNKMNLVNATTDLLTVLTNLQSTLNTFMGVLAGFSGMTAPVTQAMLQAPAATAVTALGVVLTELDSLLG